MVRLAVRAPVARADEQDQACTDSAEALHYFWFGLMVSHTDRGSGYVLYCQWQKIKVTV